MKYKKGDVILYRGMVKRVKGPFSEDKRRPGIVMEILPPAGGDKDIQVLVVPCYSTAKDPWAGPPRYVLQRSPKGASTKNGLDRPSQAAVANVSVVPASQIERVIGTIDSIDLEIIKSLLEPFRIEIMTLYNRHVIS